LGYLDFDCTSGPLFFHTETQTLRSCRREHRRTPDQCFSIAAVDRLRTTAVLIAFVHVDGFVAICPTFNLRTTSPTSSGWNIKVFFREKKTYHYPIGLVSFTDSLNLALKSGQRHLFEPHQHLVHISQPTVFCPTDNV